MKKPILLILAPLAIIGTLLVLQHCRRLVDICINPSDTDGSLPPGSFVYDENTRSLLVSLKNSRDILARQLNQQRRTIGQQQCQNSKNRTNASGGWCRDSSKEDSGQHVTDKNLVMRLSKVFESKTVGSFGDGPGAYKREILKTGLVAVYDAYDGAPYCEETSEGRVTFMDLTVPQYGIPMYDWVISLEVAEHIPAQFEDVYIDNIVRHAREGIILSWAVPGQGGLAHINNRPLQYVLDLMSSNGFIHDQELTRSLQEAATYGWLKQNTNAFRRAEASKITELEEWHL